MLCVGVGFVLCVGVGFVLCVGGGVCAVCRGWGLCCV